jgi:hypothetical protein
MIQNSKGRVRANERINSQKRKFEIAEIYKYVNQCIVKQRPQSTPQMLNDTSANDHARFGQQTTLLMELAAAGAN